MTNNGKMTKKERLNAMLAAHDFNAEEKAFILHEIELLEKKNSGDRKPTKQQEANAGIAENLLATMEPKMLYTVTDLCKLMGVESNQRMTHIVTPLVKEGKLKREVEKRRAYYSLA